MFLLQDGQCKSEGGAGGSDGAESRARLGHGPAESQTICS